MGLRAGRISNTKPDQSRQIDTVDKLKLQAPCCNVDMIKTKHEPAWHCSKCGQIYKPNKTKEGKWRFPK